MFYLFVYTLLLLLAWKWIGRNNILTSGLFITYSLSAIAAIVFYYLDPDSIVVNNTNYEPLFYLFLILLVFFIGFRDFSFKVNKFNTRKKSLIYLANIVSWIFVPVVLLLIYNDINVLRNVNLAQYRVVGDYYSTGLFKGGLVLSLFIYISELFFVPQFLFFYVLQYEEVGKWVKIRLLFASFSFAFMTLLFAGRDGIVYWVMNALIFYFLFKNAYTDKVKKIIKRGGVIVFALLMIPFLAISIARFFIVGAGSAASSITPLVEYIGQPPHIFCQSFYINSEDISGYDKEGMSNAMLINLQLYLGWTFGTFVKSLVWHAGKIGAFLIAFAFCFIVRIICKMYNIKQDIWSLFIVIMFFQVPFWGVFYYRHALNKVYIVHLLFMLICLIMYMTKNRIRRD